jgi:DNA adenine methylase
MALDIIGGLDDDRVVRYPGGKGKTYQHVINLLPPHSTYVETHLGGGAVLRHKRPAENTIGVDIDPDVINLWRERFPGKATLVEDDALAFLRRRHFDPEDVIYCDPPYLPSTRRAARVYRFDYCEADHEKLLTTLRELPCRVVISGYPSHLYDEYLQAWNSKSFMSKAQDELREERLWFNFSRPQRLHDWRFLGDDFRRRQNIKRRFFRAKYRISQMPLLEQQMLLEWLESRLHKGPTA